MLFKCKSSWWPLGVADKSGTKQFKGRLWNHEQLLENKYCTTNFDKTIRLIRTICTWIQPRYSLISWSLAGDFAHHLHLSIFSTTQLTLHFSVFCYDWPTQATFLTFLMSSHFQSTKLYQMESHKNFKDKNPRVPIQSKPFP